MPNNTDININVRINTKDGTMVIEQFGKKTTQTLNNTAKSAEQTSNRMGQSFGGLKSAVDGLRGGMSNLGTGFLSAAGPIAGVAAALGTGLVVMKQSLDAYSRTESALLGLSSVAKAYQQDIEAANQAAISLSEDGMMSVAEASLGLKNLLGTGLNLQQAIELMGRLKESAAFNRQAHYAFGEAVVATTEGIKNENSVMSDAVGVTTNLFKMYEQYAKAQGTNVQNLTKEQKALAAYNGFMQETQKNVGDLEKSYDTLGGQQQRWIGLIEKTERDIGKVFGPPFAKTLKTAGDNFEEFIKRMEEKKDTINLILDKFIAFEKIGWKITTFLPKKSLASFSTEASIVKKFIKNNIKSDQQQTKQPELDLMQIKGVQDETERLKGRFLMASAEKRIDAYTSELENTLKKLQTTKLDELKAKKASMLKTAVTPEQKSLVEQIYQEELKKIVKPEKQKNQKEEIIRAIPWETGIQYKKSLEERRKLFAPAWASELGTYDEEFFKTTSSEQRALMIQNRKSEFLKIRNQRLFGKNLETVFQGWFFDVPEAMAEKAIKDAESKSRTRRSIQARKPQLYQDFQQLFQGAFVDAPKAMSEQWLENIHKIAPEWETTMQSMKQASEDTTHDIYYGFKNIFTAGLKGDMQGIKGAWQNMLAEMQNEWFNAMAKMAVNKLFKNLFPSLFSSLGFGGGGGGGGGAASGLGDFLPASTSLSLAKEGAVFPQHWIPFKTFASGGIVNRATLGLVGEAGYPEAVIPMKNYKIPVEIINRKSSGSSSAADSINQRPIFIAPIYIIANDGNSVKNMFDKNPNLIAKHLLHATRYNSAFRKQIASI